MTLAEAAASADTLAQAGSERELADLRSEWGEELESAARSADFRERAVAFRAIGQFRWRAKEELLRRGLDDESPACRGSALLSLELLSRDHPSTVNGVRVAAAHDGDAATGTPPSAVSPCSVSRTDRRSATRSSSSKVSPTTTRATRSFAAPLPASRSS